ncbi:MAG: type II toxin-antitoxin system Phd/YefM family antitoxin [Acidimicrobiales bacterium]
MSWQLQEAKQHFSEVVERARQGEPQVVTKHGKDAVVIISIEDYQELARDKRSLMDFIRSAPDFDQLDLYRSKDTGRDVALELLA